MSSHRSKGKGRATSQLTFPSGWSEWERREEERCYRRYRLVAPGEYDIEYEYDDKRAMQPGPAQFPCGECDEPFPTAGERDRHYQTIHANDGDRPHKCNVPGCQAGVLSWTKEDKLRAHNKQWHGPHCCPENGCVHGYPNGYGAEKDLHDHLKTAHGTLTYGSSYTATSLDSITEGVASTTLGTMGPHITTSDPRTNEEGFDPNYRVHAEGEFKFGKVFKLLWTEPAGNPLGSQRTEVTESVRVGRYQEKHYEKVRRFVVISAKRGHCLCLPINTYSNQGTNKKGVHAEDHAIIYTDKPTRFEGELEKGLSKSPIRVIPVSGRHKLDKASRLNYAKVYTIEYNVKVWFIGKIHSASEDKIVADYNATHPPLTTSGSYGLGSLDSTYAHATGGNPNPYFTAATTASTSSYSQANAYQNSPSVYVAQGGPTPSGHSNVSSYYQARGSYGQDNSAPRSPYDRASENSTYSVGATAYGPRQSSTAYLQGQSYSNLQDLSPSSYPQGQSSTSYTQAAVPSGYNRVGETSGYYQPAEPRSYPISHPPP